jgi:uncharacterized protein (DUF2141 family)
MKNLLTIRIFLTLIVSFAAFANLASAIELTITVSDIKAAEGQIILRVYTPESEWLSTYQNGPFKTAVISLKDLKGDSLEQTFDLPKGRYAVTALQDLNDNSKLDKNWMGIPTEPIGETERSSAKKGPPKFEDTSFNLSATSKKRIKLIHY